MGHGAGDISADLEEALRSKCVVQVVGPKDSGKTGAIVEAVKVLVGEGYSVAVIKHTHHSVDTPAKDTWRYIREGGASVSIAIKGSGEEVAVFLRGDRGDVGRILAAALEASDIVLVEGYSGRALGEVVAVEMSPLGSRPSDEIVRIARKCLEKRASMSQASGQGSIYDHNK